MRDTVILLSSDLETAFISAGMKTSIPHVHFVVSDKKDNFTKSMQPFNSKSVYESHGVYAVEQNRLERNIQERHQSFAKIKSITREHVVESSTAHRTIEEIQANASHTSIRHLIFPEMEKDDYSSCSLPIQSRNQVHPINSPPRVKSSTLFNAESSNMKESSYFDPDESVPRKPFISWHLYSGKAKVAHSHFHKHVELPIVGADQKKSSLGIDSSANSEDSAYASKQQPERIQKRVCFAQTLPLLRDSGSDLSSAQTSSFHIPTFGKRSVTLDSINISSEKNDPASMYAKYMPNKTLQSSRLMKRFGVTLTLPKINILSNIYDEKIIKMIQEYLQDSITPSRQSQLAKELLLNLQRHGDTTKVINVPNANRKLSRKDRCGITTRQHLTEPVNSKTFIHLNTNASLDSVALMSEAAATIHNPLAIYGRDAHKRDLFDRVRYKPTLAIENVNTLEDSNNSNNILEDIT